MKCPSQNGRCRMFCIGACDPDCRHELHKEAIHAEDSEKAMTWQERVRTQGTLHLRLNGTDLATIDPNTMEVTGLPTTLSFDQFTYINNLLETIKNA